MSTPSAAEFEAIQTRGAFTVCVIPSSTYFASRSNQSLALPCHATVLRPLLRRAVEAWAYEMKEDSAAFESGRGILARKAGKYAITLADDPITGHELFWNAAGGQRGSIVLLFEPATLPSAEIFPHCERVFVVNNPSTCHTPAAVRYAKAATSGGALIAGMLSRTNGMQWLSFHGHPDLLLPLFSQAKALTRAGMIQR